MNRIYLDNSATTPLDPSVFEKMKPYFCDVFGNANSLHSFGQDARQAVDEARERVARAIGASPFEIYFTSGGTEADNWAIKGITQAQAQKGNHLIVSCIEHAAVREAARAFAASGGRVSEIPVDEKGIIILSELERLIDEKTVLISVMYANNEIGTVQPIDEVVKIASRHGVKVHTDAVQAVGSLPVNVKQLGVDLLSLSAHKFYGPKGVGALYIKNGVRVAKLVVGGHQERTLRGGTTNVPLVVGLSYAIEKAVADREANNAHIKMLRDRFVRMVEEQIPEVIYNGHPTSRLVQNANFSFKYLEGESILISLDLAGVATSSGSACSSGSLDPSHVLLAIGLPHETAHGSIRFSFGKYNTVQEVDETVARLAKIIKRLREMSPLCD